jgi:hypothetical protein
MATDDTSDQDAPTTQSYCVECGTRLAGGQFCPGCGHPVGEPASASVDPPEPEVPTEWDDPATEELSATGAGQEFGAGEAARPASRPTGAWPDNPPYADAGPPRGPTPTSGSGGSPSSGGGRGKLIAAIAAGVVVLVAGIVVAVLVLSGGDDNDVAYKEKVATAFGPVLGANQEVSDALGKLQGTKTQDGISAVRRAQQATTMASGALSALSAPSGSEDLASKAREVIVRENAYLPAVGAVLANPASASRNEIQSLESNLVSALSAAGPAVAGPTQTVSGADALSRWAPKAEASLKKKAKKRKPKQPAPPKSNPYASGRNCGGSLYAGPATSCEFAENVRIAWLAAPGLTNSVQVFSPVTHQTYTMDCAPSGNGITCSGGNNASVTF